MTRACPPAPEGLPCQETFGLRRVRQAPMARSQAPRTLRPVCLVRWAPSPLGQARWPALPVHTIARSRGPWHNRVSQSARHGPSQKTVRRAPWQATSSPKVGAPHVLRIRLLCLADHAFRALGVWWRHRAPWRARRPAQTWRVFPQASLLAPLGIAPPTTPCGSTTQTPFSLRERFS